MATDYTDWGPIHHGGPCRDDYDNIRIYDQHERGWAPLKMQEAAIRSLRDVEVKWANRTTPWKRRRHVRCTGTWRSCDLQRTLYEKDSDRYAHPDESLHPRGLAMDVYYAGPFVSPVLWWLLRRHGWYQLKGEPWHWSYGVAG